MPWSGFRPRAADVVRPGGDGRQIVIAQKLSQLLHRGLVQVVPRNVCDDSVTFVSPRPCLGMGKHEYTNGDCRQPSSDEAETHNFDDSVAAFARDADSAPLRYAPAEKHFQERSAELQIPRYARDDK